MLFNNIIVLKISGEQIERFLNMCSFHKIKLYDVQRKEQNCFLKIHADDFFHLKDICRKTHVKTKIIYKKGIYFFILKYTKKHIFFITAFLSLLVLCISSRFLWGIKIEGNQTITNDLITDYLQEHGIHYGMPLSQIPIYELKTNIRNTYDEIKWISIYLKGTNLHISIRENDTVKPDSNISFSYSDMIASENGIVDSIIVRQGTPMVKAGDTVAKGDILISGKVDIIADDYTIKETYLCHADGDVYLIYDYPIQEQLSLEYLAKEYTGKEIQRKKIYLKSRLIPIPYFPISFTINPSSIPIPFNFP